VSIGGDGELCAQTLAFLTTIRPESPLRALPLISRYTLRARLHPQPFRVDGMIAMQLMHRGMSTQRMLGASSARINRSGHLGWLRFIG